MKDLTIIHSFVDRSSIVLVRIPLKTARLSSLFSALLPIWVYLSCSSEPLPLICSTPRQRSQTGTRKAFKLQYRITTQIFTFSNFLCFILSFFPAGFFSEYLKEIHLFIHFRKFAIQALSRTTILQLHRRLSFLPKF